eukprot:2425003-Amphidinium_carterae.1
MAAPSSRSREGGGILCKAQRSLTPSQPDRGLEGILANKPDKKQVKQQPQWAQLSIFGLVLLLPSVLRP